MKKRQTHTHTQTHARTQRRAHVRSYHTLTPSTWYMHSIYIASAPFPCQSFSVFSGMVEKFVCLLLVQYEYPTDVSADVCIVFVFSLVRLYFLSHFIRCHILVRRSPLAPIEQVYGVHFGMSIICLLRIIVVIFSSLQLF